MIQNNNVFINKIVVACEKCSLRQLCLPKMIEVNEIKRLDDIVERKLPLKKGGFLFRQGDEFKSIYVVRSGSIKTYAPGINGEEQIMGIHLPGELLGFDALSDGCYTSSAKALEISNLCEIPFFKVEELSQRIPGLQHQLLLLMSKEVSNEHQTILFLGKKTAEERLATYLLSLSQRLKTRGFSPNEFNLTMTRADIANYLNLAVETVSRMFTNFQKNSLIRCEGRKITILSRENLAQTAGVEIDLS